MDKEQGKLVRPGSIPGCFNIPNGLVQNGQWRL